MACLIFRTGRILRASRKFLAGSSRDLEWGFIRATCRRWHGRSTRASESDFVRAGRATIARDARPLASHRILRFYVPGRIEVLGKHTDYAGGRSLLCAAERGICIAVAPRDDATLHLVDVIGDREAEIPFSMDASSRSHWLGYVTAVARRLAGNFPGALRGADIVFGSDLPRAAGMSSSSALVIAIFAALSGVNHLFERAEYKSNIRSDEDLATYLACIENGQSLGTLAGDYRSWNAWRERRSRRHSVLRGGIAEPVFILSRAARTRSRVSAMR